MMIVPKMFYNITNDLGPSDAQFIKWRRDEVPRYVFKKKDFEYIPTMSRVWDMVECVHARPETTTVQRTEHGRLAAGSGMVWSSVQGRFLSLRNRALILAMAMTGVRKNCIKKWTYGLIRECVEGRCGHNHPVTEGKIGFPFYLRITTGLDAKLREYKVPYYHTFLHRDGATPLLEYLSAREAAGWNHATRASYSYLRVP